MNSAYLVFDDGRIFEGQSWGATGKTFGEAVFQTGMTYHKQIVIMTAPHIGNTGVNKEDNESGKIWVAGFVVRNPSPLSSNWRSHKTLESELINQEIIGIQGVDTRAITRHIRDRGAMRVGIFSNLNLSREEMVVEVRKIPLMAGSNLVEDVSTKNTYVVEPIGQKRFVVAALDLGIKNATPKGLSERGVQVHVMPSDSTLEQILAINPDGVFLSNGPGDPSTMGEVVETVRALLLEEIPIFGICFGHQILGRALG